MSNQLHDPLHDLLAEVPSYVVPDAREAWVSGARRRTRRRIGATGLVVLLVLLVSAGIGVLPRPVSVAPVDQPGGGVDGHPSRIDYPYWTHDLPNRPGPVAGVLSRVHHGSTSVEPLGWYAVSPTGHLWKLPGSENKYLPALSPDGTQLAYLDTRLGQGFEIRHLTTGGTTSISVGVHQDGSREPWRLDAQAPSFWSPDSQQLLVRVAPAAGNLERGVDALVYGVGLGTTTPVRLAGHGSAYPIGWVSDRALAWLVRRPADGAAPDGVDVLVTDVRGRLQRTVRLQIAGDAALSELASAAVSGHSLALGSQMGRQGDAIRFYSLQGDDFGGTRTGTMPGVHDAAAGCPASWGDRNLQVPASMSDRDAALVSVNGGATILADPRLDLACSLWAEQALDGPAHEGLGGWLFGERTSWLSWHWREVGLSIGGGLAVVGGLLLLRRRRVSG